MSQSLTERIRPTEESDNGHRPFLDPPSWYEGSLASDQLWEALNSPRRRRVLRLLNGNGDHPISMGEVAEEVAAIEFDTTPDAVTAQERKRVYVSLYQFHAKKMAEWGLIEHDERSGEMVATDEVRHLEPFL